VQEEYEDLLPQNRTSSVTIDVDGNVSRETPVETEEKNEE
jgi:hypothetical protein